MPCLNLMLMLLYILFIILLMDSREHCNQYGYLTKHFFIAEKVYSFCCVKKVFCRCIFNHEILDYSDSSWLLFDMSSTGVEKQMLAMYTHQLQAVFGRICKCSSVPLKLMYTSCILFFLASLNGVGLVTVLYVESDGGNRRTLIDFKKAQMELSPRVIPASAKVKPQPL